MRTGAAHGFVGHVHEAGFYSSDAEFLALSVPFVTGGIAAGEPVVIGYDHRKCDLLRAELARPDAASFIAVCSSDPESGHFQRQGAAEPRTEGRSGTRPPCATPNGGRLPWLRSGKGSARPMGNRARFRGFEGMPMRGWPGGLLPRDRPSLTALVHYPIASRAPGT